MPREVSGNGCEGSFLGAVLHAESFWFGSVTGHRIGSPVPFRHAGVDGCEQGEQEGGTVKRFRAGHGCGKGANGKVGSLEKGACSLLFTES